MSRPIDGDALLDAMPKNDELFSIAVRRVIVDAPTLDVVTMDAHKKCMEAEIKKRVLTEKTNQRILENYVPVCHGRWIWDEVSFNYTCSSCKCSFDYSSMYGLFDHGFEYAGYCPNCGAKMDGGKDDENT